MTGDASEREEQEDEPGAPSPPATSSALDRLIAEGRVSPPRRRGLPGPLALDGDPYALSRALDDIRGGG